MENSILNSINILSDYVRLEANRKGLSDAKAVLVVNSVKGGAWWSFEYGSGIVLVKKSNGDWSAPCAVKLMGVGVGPLVGSQMKKEIILLHSTDIVQSFVDRQAFFLAGVSWQYAVASKGYSQEFQSSLTVDRCVSINSSSSINEGFLAGASLQGTMVSVVNEANDQFYGKNLSPKAILTGSITIPSSANCLCNFLKKMEGGSFSCNSGFGFTIVKNSENSGESDRFLTFLEGQLCDEEKSTLINCWEGYLDEKVSKDCLLGAVSTIFSTKGDKGNSNCVSTANSPSLTNSRKIQRNDSSPVILSDSDTNSQAELCETTYISKDISNLDSKTSQSSNVEESNSIADTKSTEKIIQSISGKISRETLEYDDDDKGINKNSIPAGSSFSNNSSCNPKKLNSKKNKKRRKSGTKKF